MSIVNPAPTSSGLGDPVGPGETIDILVQPRRGLPCSARRARLLEVPATGESLPLQFKLQAVNGARARSGSLAFHHGEPLGVIDARADRTAAAAKRARRTDRREPRTRPDRPSSRPARRSPTCRCSSRSARSPVQARVRDPAHGHGPGARSEPAAVRAVHGSRSTRQLLRVVLPGDRDLPLDTPSSSAGGRPAPRRQGRLPEPRRSCRPDLRRRSGARGPDRPRSSSSPRSPGSRGSSAGCCGKEGWEGRRGAVPVRGVRR